MGSGEDTQFVFAKYDYTAQGNQVRFHFKFRHYIPDIISVILLKAKIFFTKSRSDFKCQGNNSSDMDHFLNPF